MKVIIEHISTLRILVDFGLVILIWMVQLIVYPGFSHYSTKGLLRWHKIYTPRITLIVAPLMFAQLGIGFYLLIFEYSILNLIYALLVISTWISTFVYFVPLHQNIENQIELENSVSKLIRWNWARTLQWTLIFIYGVLMFCS